MSNTVWKSTKKSWKCAENIINWSQCYNQTNTSNGCVIIFYLILDFDILFFILDLIVFLYVCISKTLITHQRSRQSLLQKQVQQRFFTKFIVTIMISWCRFYPSVWQFCTTSHSLQWIWLWYIFSSWCCLMTFLKRELNRIRLMILSRDVGTNLKMKRWLFSSLCFWEVLYLHSGSEDQYSLMKSGTNSGSAPV